MYLSIGRFLTIVVIFALVFFLANVAWLAIPHTDLLAALWKFSFVAAACATIGYQVRSKYSELIEHPSLTESEFRRLNSIITKRRGHITIFVLLGFLVALLLAMSNLFNHLPEFAPWYFKLVTSALAVEVVFFVYVLLSFREIEAFKTKLEKRKRTSEEKKRLLDKLNGDKT
ncbi:MAG: hypothetical protein V3W04_01215 [Gammaproteobacteria bacterium]